MCILVPKTPSEIQSKKKELESKLQTLGGPPQTPGKREYF